MEFIVNVGEFSNILEVIEKGLPLRSTIPVINNIFLNVTGNTLSFSSTNLETYIQADKDYDSSGEAKILLPPKIIELFRYFPSDEAIINIDFESYQIDIKSGTSQFRLYGADPKDYPVYREDLSSNLRYSIKQPVLKDVLKKTIFAASSDETRPAFNGIHFSFQDNTIVITASDTYRLVMQTVQDDKWQFPISTCLVPAKAMRELLRILSDVDRFVEFSLEDEHITFYLGNIIFSARLLQEKFPEVSGVIPKDYKTRVTVDRKSIEESVTRATLLTEGKNQAVTLSILDNRLEVKVSSQLGGMEENLSITKEGEDVKLLVNTRFILDFLKIISNKEIYIDLHGDGSPLIFRLSDDSNYLYLVLPIKKLTD